MARPVLAPYRFLAVVFAFLCAATGRAECVLDGLAAVPTARQDGVREFERQVKLAPFYKELTRRFGTPETCTTKFDDGNIDLSFAYRGDARLNATLDTRIEFTEQRIQLSGLTLPSGIALLKKAETNGFGAKGCGIAWRSPAETVAGEAAGSREAVYRGNTCNCQAKVTYAGGSVVGLAISSAC